MLVDPTACANGSGRQLTDQLPPGSTAYAIAAAPCEYCGHPGCWPGQRCIHCAVELRLQALENTAGA